MIDLSDLVISCMISVQLVSYIFQCWFSLIVLMQLLLPFCHQLHLYRATLA